MTEELYSVTTERKKNRNIFSSEVSNEFFITIFSSLKTAKTSSKSSKISRIIESNEDEIYHLRKNVSLKVIHLHSQSFCFHLPFTAPFVKHSKLPKRKLTLNSGLPKGMNNIRGQMATRRYFVS